MDPNSLLFFSILSVFAASPADNSAHQALFNAYLKQSGIESNINGTLKYLERRELSQEAKIYIGYTAYISKTIIDKKIVIKWGFP